MVLLTTRRHSLWASLHLHSSIYRKSKGQYQFAIIQHYSAINHPLFFILHRSDGTWGCLSKLNFSQQFLVQRIPQAKINFWAARRSKNRVRNICDSSSATTGLQDLPGKLFGRYNPTILQFGELDVVDRIASVFPPLMHLDFSHRCLAQHRKSPCKFLHHPLCCDFGNTHT